MHEAVFIGDIAIPITRIEKYDFSEVEDGIVYVVTLDGTRYKAESFDAYKIVSIYAPDMEGRRLRWHKHAWAVHNIVAHPLLQILAWMGMTKLGMRIHDKTAPKPKSLKKT